MSWEICGARSGSTSVRGKMSGVQGAALELGIVANLESNLPLSDTTKQIDCEPPLKENGRLSSAKVMTDDGKLQRVKAWQRVEVGVICVVIAVVWGLLSLPVIFYYIPQVSSYQNTAGKPIATPTVDLHVRNRI